MTKKKHAISISGTHERLLSFGLTENDARIYVYLLERGTAFGGSKIATALLLHRQYVHYSLEKLLRLGLIEEVPSGARTKYRALPPSHLTHLAKKQLAEAEVAARELDRISAVGAEQDFEIYRGTKQVFDFEETVVHGLALDETQYIIGGGAETFIKFYGDRYEEISNVAASKRLRSKYVGCREETDWMKKASSVLDHFEYRVLETLPKTTVQTVIRFNAVTFYSLGNVPPLVYIIKSTEVAEDCLLYTSDAADDM
jgi:predicted transcriptional regulator